jgi:restriction system protein
MGVHHLELPRHDGPTLAELMIDYDVGVSILTTYSLKRIDSDFFDEGYTDAWL